MVINPSLAEYLASEISLIDDEVIRVSVVERPLLAHWRNNNAIMKLNTIDLQG